MQGGKAPPAGTFGLHYPSPMCTSMLVIIKGPFSTGSGFLFVGKTAYYGPGLCIGKKSLVKHLLLAI